MPCSSIAKVQVVCSTSKARTQRRSADREKSEFVGPSDSRTKQSAAVDELLSKQYRNTEVTDAPLSLSSSALYPSSLSRFCLQRPIRMRIEAVLFGSRVQREKMPTADNLNVTGAVVPFRHSVKFPGVTLDTGLTMDRHVTGVLRSCNYHTRTRVTSALC